MATTSVSITPECSICFELLKTPKILPCGHTYCFYCLKRLIGNKTETFPCPTCKQHVKIPKGGAKMFITNYIVQTSKHTNQPPSTTQPRCPNHNQKKVDYYCNNCNVGLCFRCIHVFNEHKYHETLDIESEETRNKAIEKLQSSKETIQIRKRNLEKSRTTLLESFEQLKSLCEDSCAKVTEATELIVSDLRKSCEQIIKDIRKNLEENRSKVEDREKKITSEIYLLEIDMELNISTKTTLNILQTLTRLIETEKDYNLCLQYLQWVGNDFSLDQLGSVISKPFYIPGSYQFLFNIGHIEKDCIPYNSANKFRYNNLVWSCYVVRYDNDDDLVIYITLSKDDNPKLNYCIIDGQISLLNIDDDSKFITKTYSEEKVETYDCVCPISITWSKLTNMYNGYLFSNGQFMIQYDISQIREIEFSQ